jgi:hypothetical protein
MKNIHVLPTEKPSRLVIDTIENKLYYQPILHNKTVNVLPQNICITSDEKIKEGDYVFNLISKEVYPILELWEVVSYEKKIILTTNSELIEEGVQSIDDEFLKWFVKNPSCEFIKTDLVPVNEFNSEITVSGYGFDKFIYKIINPKKEPKQLTDLEIAIKLEEIEREETKLEMMHGGVKWLIEQLNKPGFAQVVTDEEIKQAIEMQKAQMIEFANSFYDECGMQYGGLEKSAEQYYNETFNANKQ